ncbi:MAG: PcfB family protein [Clostridia bacterium]|nr:PcfB family protein [Clostridia bacterium]
MNSSDSAEEVVRISLEGMEVALKIAGTGAKNMAVMIYTIMKDKQQTKGKTRLTNMLKTGKPLKIFTIRAEDLKKFSQEAKKYGVLYCALADKKNSKIDGMVDIMVREEDASKMNRIAERFNFRDVASIKRELEQEMNKTNSQEVVEIAKSEEDQFIDDIMPKPKEELQQEIPSNNTKETEEKSPLGISSNIKSDDKMESSDEEKKSVKKELKEIADELKIKEEKEKQQEKQDIPVGNAITKDKEKEKKTPKKEKEKYKGKHFKEPKHLDYTPRKKRRKKERSKTK